jgi:hypothetical protein
MRALAAMLFAGCVALHPAASTTAVRPPSASASAAASDGAPPAPPPTTDPPSGQPDPADNPEPDSESADVAAAEARIRHDHVEEDEAAALRGLTVDQAKQWLAARGYRGELQIFDERHDEFFDTDCAVDTVCDWEPRQFTLEDTLQISIRKSKLRIAPPP